MFVGKPLNWSKCPVVTNVMAMPRIMSTYCSLFSFICGWLYLEVVLSYLPIVYFFGFAVEVDAYFEYFSVISGKGICISFFFYLVQSFLG